MKLILKQKLISLHDKMTIRNEDGDVMYTVKSAAVSLSDKTYIQNANGDDVAYIHKKPISIHNKYYVELVNGDQFELSSELFHVIKDIMEIPQLDWSLEGNLMEHDYKIIDSHGNVVASTHKKWITLHHVYEIDINDEKNIDKIVAIYVCLEHILSTRAGVRSTTSQASQ